MTASCSHGWWSNCVTPVSTIRARIASTPGKRSRSCLRQCSYAPCAAGSVLSDYGIAGFVVPAHVGQHHICGQLCALATRLGIDRRSGDGADRVWPGRRSSRGAGDRYAGLAGYGRLLESRAGHVVAVAACAGIASGLLAAAAYAVVLLMPAQSWVLAAADSYAHFATLPVGLWTLAALIELGERSLPTASLVRSSARRSGAATDIQADRSSHDDARSPVASPTL